MKDIIEQLQEEIDAETDLWFIPSEEKSSTSCETEPDNGTKLSNSSPSSPYNITPLTNETRYTTENRISDNNLHSVKRESVIARLDEILLQLIMIREMACGKELIRDLRWLFNVDLSPGTVYPHLNNLADEGTVDKTELKSKKIYTIADINDTLERIETAADRQVLFGLFMQSLLKDIKSRRLQSQRSEMDEQ